MCGRHKRKLLSCPKALSHAFSTQQLCTLPRHSLPNWLWNSASLREVQGFARPSRDFTVPRVYNSRGPSNPSGLLNKQARIYITVMAAVQSNPCRYVELARPFDQSVKESLPAIPFCLNLIRIQNFCRQTF